MEKIRPIAGPLIRQALPKDIKDYLVLTGSMELSHAIFELMKKCSPGGPAERKMLLGRIQRPLLRDPSGNDIQVIAPSEVLKIMKKWMDKVERVNEMASVALPDPSLLWDALKKMVDPAVELDNDLAHELRTAKQALELETNATAENVFKIHRMLIAEFERKKDDVEAENGGISKTQQKKQERMKRLPDQGTKGQEDPKGKGKGKEKGDKGKKAKKEFPIRIPLGKVTRVTRARTKERKGPVKVKKD